MHSHQFLQTFFFFAAPSPQMGALREDGSGFFKSSSSRRASVSTRSWPRKNKQRKTQSACRAARAGLICESEFEPTTSSSSMSLADNDHILTVLGSRTGFSAEIRVVANVSEFFEGDFGATQICKICKKPKNKTMTTAHLAWPSSSQRTVWSGWMIPPHSWVCRLLNGLGSEFFLGNQWPSWGRSAI